MSLGGQAGGGWWRAALAALAFASVALAAVAVGPAGRAAAADSGIRFLDDRPVLVDLDQLPPAGRWQVMVFNGESARAVQVTVQASSTPAGLLAVEPATAVTVPAGGVATFVLVLASPRSGTGQLTALSTDGTLATRAVTLEAGSSHLALPEEAAFTALHVAPWATGVHLAPVRLFGVTSGSQPVVVGVVASSSGRSGRVVLKGDRLLVDGLPSAGEYRGTAVLPGQRLVKVRVEAHDAVGFPLLALVAGLVLVGILDRFNRRDKPRQVLEIHLVRIQMEARQKQHAANDRPKAVPALRPSGVHRISDETGARKLLLDRRVEEALASWDGAVDEAERGRWAEGETGLAQLEALVAALGHINEQIDSLLDEAAHLLTLLPGGSLPPKAVVTADIEAALRPCDLTSEEGLQSVEKALAAARESVAVFTDLYERLGHLESTAGADLAQRARGLSHGLRGGSRYAEVEAETKKLEAADAVASQFESDSVDDQAVGPAAASATAAPAAASPALEGGSSPLTTAGPGSERRLERRQRRRSPVLLAAAAALVGVVVVAAGALRTSSSRSTSAPSPVTRSTLGAAPGLPGRPVPGPGAPGGRRPGSGARAGGSPQEPSGGGVPPAPTTTTLPDAPVALLVHGAPVPDAPSGGASIAEVAVKGVAVPVAMALALGALAWGVLEVVKARRRRRRRRQQGPAAPQTLIDALRRDQLRFDALSGVIVVLTGLSVLYFSNPTFGSLGDYAKMLLWGSGVGEGVQLARRLIPALPT